jgi:predicted nucleic acid-binding protein
MKKIIVDTNIIFSTLLNSNGTIGDLIFNSDYVFVFYSCDYMRHEIHKHWSKLIKISKLTDGQLKNAFEKVLTKITFINEAVISSAIWLKAEQTVKDIDHDDVDFVALTSFLKGCLWTGDKELYNGLKNKQFRCVYNTDDIFKQRDKRRY